MTENDHRELVKQISAVAEDVGEVKVQVAQVNGKIDALTVRQTESWANVLDRIQFTERAAQQAVTTLSDRISVVEKHANERHQAVTDEIQGATSRIDQRIDNLVQDEIKPLKLEAKVNAEWRNKVIGWAAGASFVAGIAGGLIVKMW